MVEKIVAVVFSAILTVIMVFLVIEQASIKNIVGVILASLAFALCLYFTIRSFRKLKPKE